MHGKSEANLPRTARRTPIVLIRPPSAPSDPSPGSAPCRGCCSRTPFRLLLLLLPCLLLRRRRPGPRRACRASSLRSYPRTRGRSSFGNCAAGTTGSAVRFRDSRRRPVGSDEGEREKKRGVVRWFTGRRGGAFGGYRATHNATMRFTTLQNMSASMLGRHTVRRSTTEPVESGSGGCRCEAASAGVAGCSRGARERDLGGRVARRNGGTGREGRGAGERTVADVGHPPHPRGIVHSLLADSRGAPGRVTATATREGVVALITACDRCGHPLTRN